MFVAGTPVSIEATPSSGLEAIAAFWANLALRYEINFNRYFYRYVPPRPLAEIDAELKALEAEIAGLLREVVA